MLGRATLLAEKILTKMQLWTNTAAPSATVHRLKAAAKLARSPVCLRWEKSKWTLQQKRETSVRSGHGRKFVITHADNAPPRRKARQQTPPLQLPQAAAAVEVAAGVERSERNWRHVQVLTNLCFTGTKAAATTTTRWRREEGDAVVHCFLVQNRDGEFRCGCMH